MALNVSRNYVYRSRLFLLTSAVIQMKTKNSNLCCGLFGAFGVDKQRVIKQMQKLIRNARICLFVGISKTGYIFYSINIYRPIWFTGLSFYLIFGFIVLVNHLEAIDSHRNTNMCPKEHRRTTQR